MGSAPLANSKLLLCFVDDLIPTTPDYLPAGGVVHDIFRRDESGFATSICELVLYLH